MKYLANSPNNLEAEVTGAESKKDTENALINPIVAQSKQEILQNNADNCELNIPNTRIKDNIEFARNNGFYVVPIAPYYPVDEYSQTNPKTGELEPKFTGKRVSYIDSRNHPVMIDKWEVFKNTFAAAKTLEMWFQHPDMGIAWIGTEYRVLYDLDRKNFESQEACNNAFFAWVKMVEDKVGRKFKYGKTQSGGWRVPIKLIQPCTFTNFTHEQGSKNHVGEIKGRGGYAVVCLDKTETGNPYTWLNDEQILEVTSLEQIGIYSTAQVKEKSVKDVKELTHMGDSEDALDIIDLISLTAKDILEGKGDTADRSDTLTKFIKEVYGWVNWLELNRLDYNTDPIELIDECGAVLGCDDAKTERVIKSIKDLDSCQPSRLSEGSDIDCWTQIKYVNKKVFEQCCPLGIYKEINSKTNKGKSRKQEAPLESEVVESLVELYKTELAWDGTYKRNLIYQGDSTKPNFGIYQEIQEEEVDRIIFAYLDSKNYAYKGAYPYNVKKYLKSKLWVKEFYSSHLNKIPLIDGVLNLSTMALEPHCQANRFDFCLPYKWVDKSLGCQPILDWLLWVCEGDELKRELLLAWMNCIVLNKVEYQKFLILTGAGGSGKGTFIRLCTALIGAANTADTTLPAMETNRFETATYIGKKLITVNEVENFSGSLTVLKNITGQDNIRFEEKYKQGGSAPIPALLMIAANHDINSSENSSAIFRRRIALEFNRVVSDGEKRNLISFNTHRLPTGDFVPYLAGLLEYVLAMNPERVKQLITQTNLYVPSLRKTAMEVTANSSPLAEWANYSLVLRTGVKTNVGCLKTPTSDITMRNTYANLNNWLYPHYVSFCEAHNYKPLSTVKFSHNLNDLLVNQLKLDVIKGKDYKSSFFKGIAIRQEQDTDPLLLTGECTSNESSISKDFLEKILALPCLGVNETDNTFYDYPALADIED